MVHLPDSERWLEIGTVVAPYGIRGELKVLSSTDFPERFEQKGKRWLQSPQGEAPTAVRLTQGRRVPGKNLFIVRLAEVTDRHRAESLVGYRLLIQDGDRLPLAPDEYHVADLIGLDVYHHTTQTHLGTVTDLFEAGNALLEVTLKVTSEAETTPKKVLIPFVAAIVPVVNVAQKRIEILPPAGLLDL